jgi:hypothetical protein
MEKFMPLGALRRMLRPLAAVTARLALARQPAPEPFHGPANLQAADASAVFNATVDSYLARALNFIPDRFVADKWHGQCRFHGEVPAVSNQPVILATLHFGPLHLLRYWLRARGFLVTTLVEELPGTRTLVKHLKDRLSDAATGLQDIPHVISRNELFKVRQCAQPGRMLMISVDHHSGKQVQINAGASHLRLATGAIRLAASLNARLIPCLMTESGPWQFDIHFGQPVPAELLGDDPDLARAASHLWHEFLPVVAQHPEQIGGELRCCFLPVAVSDPLTARCLT